MLQATRILRAAIAATMLLVLLAPLAADAAKTEVRWLQWKTSEVGEKLMDELKAAFEKENPDITLTLLDSPFAGYHDKAITLFQAQKLADVLMITVDWPVEFAELGMLQPLDAFIAREPKEFFDNIFPTFHQKWRGRQYYLPIELGCVALYWNTEVFKKAGVPGPPKTWDEYVQIAKKVTNPEQKIFATTGTMSAEPPTNLTYDIFPLIWQPALGPTEDATFGLGDTQLSAFLSPSDASSGWVWGVGAIAQLPTQPRGAWATPTGGWARPRWSCACARATPGSTGS